MAVETIVRGDSEDMIFGKPEEIEGGDEIMKSLVDFERRQIPSTSIGDANFVDDTIYVEKVSIRNLVDFAQKNLRYFSCGRDDKISQGAYFNDSKNFVLFDMLKTSKECFCTVSTPKGTSARDFFKKYVGSDSPELLN